jgi:hypothetical protein
MAHDRIFERTEIALALHAIIPDKANAITFSGGAGDSCRMILDVYSDQPEELLKLLHLRGERLIVTFIKEDDVT